MMKGVIVELSELIALQRHAQQAASRRTAFTAQTGGHLSNRRGRGMDLAEVRNYQAGDEIRHMEWRVTARTGRPHVKVYQEERERPVVIVVDFNPSMYFGTRIAFKSVIAARLASVLAWTVAKQGDRVGGLLFSAELHHELPPQSRQRGVLPLLAGLSEYTRHYESSHAVPRSLSQAFVRLRRVARPGNLVVLISDFYQMDADSERQLSQLRSQNDIIAYHVIDPLETTPPKPAAYAITHGEETMLLDTRLEHVQQAYQAYSDERLAHAAAQCRRLQIQYVPVGPETNLPLLVRQTFPRRGIHGA